MYAALALFLVSANSDALAQDTLDDAGVLADHAFETGTPKTLLDAACDHASGGVFSSFSMALPNGTLLWCDYAADEGVEFAAAAQGNPGGIYDVVATGPDGHTRDERHNTRVDLDVDGEEIFKTGTGLVVARVVQMLDKPGTLLSGGALAGGGYGPLYVQDECNCFDYCAGDSDDMRVLMACSGMCNEDPN